MQHYDIAIVGGGVVGYSLALALRHLSLKVALIEAVAMPERYQENFDVRTLALSKSSQNILKCLNVWENVTPYSVEIQAIHISNQGSFGATRLHAVEQQLSAFGYVVDLQRLLIQLFQTIKKNTTIDHYCPATLAQLHYLESKHQYQLDLDSKQTISCDLLIGADGVHSSVRQLAGIDCDQRAYDHHALVANIALARHHRNCAYERFTEQGPLALLPMQDNRAALIWAQSPQRITHCLTLNETDFLKQLQQQFGYRLGRFIGVGKRAAFPLSLTRAKQIIKPSLVLLGNAAQSLHPIAGQGFNLALRDVARLAEVLTQAVNHKQSLGSITTLEQYYQHRKWDERRMLGFTDGLATLFKQAIPGSQLLKALLLLTADRVNFVKQELIQHSMGLSGRVPDLACGIELENK